MTKTTNLSRHKFMMLPKLTKYVLVSLMILASSFLFTIWVFASIENPWFILLGPIFYILLSIMESPMNILSGAKKHYSPLLVVKKRNDKNYHIHLGNLFDYVMALDFKSKKSSFKTQILIYSFEGILNIIDEIKRTNKLDAKVIGTSYFLSKSTAVRFGFTTKKASLAQIIVLIINYPNLVFLLSIADRKLQFPNLFKTMTIEIDAKTLISEELKIRRAYQYMRARRLKALALKEKKVTESDFPSKTNLLIPNFSMKTNEKPNINN